MRPAAQEGIKTWYSEPVEKPMARKLIDHGERGVDGGVDLRWLFY